MVMVIPMVTETATATVMVMAIRIVTVMEMVTVLPVKRFRSNDNSPVSAEKGWASSQSHND